MVCVHLAFDRAGITTIRDLGDNGLVVRVRDEIASGARSGPRILASGPPLTVAGGHCWFRRRGVDDDDSIRAMVRRNAADGADLIKVMASDGQMTPGGAKMWQSQFTAEQLRVVVTEAAVHRRYRRWLPGAVFDNMAGALGLYSWLGFPTDRIIEFVTVNAAAALGLADTTQLASGLAADLLVIDGDPPVRARRQRRRKALFTSVTPITTDGVRLVINRTGRVHILVG
jgi:imidazolonepropionase-like amidohydrolase